MSEEHGAPAPRANPDLVGHEATEAALRQLFEAGRLPHALLLSGPRGIGKATLAFRLARFVLSGAGEGALGDMFGRRSVLPPDLVLRSRRKAAFFAGWPRAGMPIC